MRTSNLSPKKRPHRSHKRNPRLYCWADIATEALIYFTILWGPWAFGTVHDWAILTMNLANYGIGALLLTKWAIRYKTGYYPPRWTTQKNSQSTTQPPKRDWRTKAVAALTIYMLGYILISIFNVRATFNHEFDFFENYNENYIKWLPHTYDQSATIQSFLNFLGLACCFWGIRDWLLGKTRKERMEVKPEGEHSEQMFLEEIAASSIPVRLNRILWLLCISGGLIALTGIIQRLDGTPKLLWIYERERFGKSTQSFGPFGYRGNGMSYLNMILPVSIGLLMWFTQKARSTQIQSGRKINESHFTLIPKICVMLSAPFISLSRGGLLILVFLLISGIFYLITNPNLLRGRQRLGLAILITAGISLSYYIGWEPLLKRLYSKNQWHETLAELPNTEETIIYECQLPPPPYDQNFKLFLITNSRNHKFRKAYFDSTLYKDGKLRIRLHDDVAKSNVNTTYPSIIPFLETGQLNLKIKRRATGLSVQANNTSLIGIENRVGAAPPTWDHPIVPNEIYVNKKGTIKNGSSDLNSRTLTIQSDSTEGKELKQNHHQIKIDLSENWSWKHFKSKSNARGRIYEDAWRMAKDYRWLGCGSGAWSTVYFLYHDIDEVWDAWAHCDWLEYWITFGVFGAIPALLLIGLALMPIKSQFGFTSANWLSIGLNLAIAGCLLHAIFDFPLQVLSIMHLFTILCTIKMLATGRS